MPATPIATVTFSKVDEATFDLITAVNMKAIYHSTLAVVPIMERQRRRRDPDDRLDRGLEAAAGPHLVQRLQGLGDHCHQVDGGRARAEEHPRQLSLPGGR